MNDGSNNVKNLLYAHGLTLRKSLGQNFLIDLNVPKKIVKLSGINADSCVLEVGPGIGALTKELCQAAKSVIAIELDERLFPILHSVLEPYDNYKLIQNDILKSDINSLIKENFGDMRCSVCANLPYNITTPALTALIESNVFADITVMIQREVARRICGKPGTADYGAFSVFINYHSEPNILFDVPPECFIPQPKVHSSVVKMKIRESRLLDSKSEKVFFRVVRAAFGQRRKTLVNALYSVFKDTLEKSDIEGVVVKCGFSPQVRGEMLSPEEFMKLSDLMPVTF